MVRMLGNVKAAEKKRANFLKIFRVDFEGVSGVARGCQTGF